MPTLPVDNIAASYIYYDAQADDARLTLTVAKTAADARRRGRQLRDARRAHEGRGRARSAARACASTATRSRSARVRSSTRPACGPTRSARSTTRTHTTTIRPAKGIHITVPWSLVRNEIAVVIPVPKDRRSVFVVPWGGDGGPHRFTYIGTTDTDYDGPIDDPQITAGRHRVPPARDQRRVDDEDHRGRHPRHVGRPAPARRRGQERTHRRPLPPPLGAHVARRRRHRHRRQAHDLPAHGGRRGRRGGQGRSGTAAAAARSGSRCTAPTAGTRPTSRRTSPSATAPTAAPSPRSNDPTRSSRRPLIENLPYSRAEVVYAARGRDGAHRRRRAVAPHPRAAARARRLGRGRRRRRRARWRPSSAGRTTNASARSRSTGRWWPRNGSRAGCPRPRSTHCRTRPPDSVVSPRADQPGSSDSSHRVRRRRRSAITCDARASRSTTRRATACARPAPR